MSSPLDAEPSLPAEVDVLMADCPDGEGPPSALLAYPAQAMPDQASLGASGGLHEPPFGSVVIISPQEGGWQERGKELGAAFGRHDELVQHPSDRLFRGMRPHGSGEKEAELAVKDGKVELVAGVELGLFFVNEAGLSPCNRSSWRVSLPESACGPRCRDAAHRRGGDNPRPVRRPCKRRSGRIHQIVRGQRRAGR